MSRSAFGERPRALALRLADRPQPRRVDVRVPDRGRAVRVGPGRGSRAPARARRAPRPPTATIVVVRSISVARRLERVARPRARARARRRAACRGAATSTQHVEVQRLHIAVHDRELGLTEPVDRRPVDIGHEQRPRRGPPRRDRVRRGLDQQLDRLAARGRPGDDVFAVLEVQSLAGLVAVPHQALGGEAHHRRRRRGR